MRPATLDSIATPPRSAGALQACDWARGLPLPGRYEFISEVTDSLHTVTYAGVGHLMLRPDFTCCGCDMVTSAEHGTLHCGITTGYWTRAGAHARMAAGARGKGAQPCSACSWHTWLTGHALSMHVYCIFFCRVGQLHAFVRPASAPVLQVRAVARPQERPSPVASTACAHPKHTKVP